MMREYIPQEILEIYNKFQNTKFEVYLVGGCVRNLLLNKKIKDWDLTTNATPQQILKLFPNGFYDNKFGTVGIPIKFEKNKIIVEVTTFRTEHGYTDKRRPDIVKWGKSLEEDLARRDFTVNAIALDLGGKEKGERNLIDPFGGQKDLQNKLVRTVGDPKLRFKEDALRLIRAIRIATENFFTIEENTWNEITKDAKLITEISGERIQRELLRILSSNYPYEGIILLKNSTLLSYLLPELLEGVGISQARPGRHHTSDVFTHNMLSLKHCPSQDPIVRFATLLHDVGKPKVQSLDEKGLVTFHNHEIVGAQIAKNICNRLKFSRRDSDKIVKLIRWHMFTVDEKITDAAVRRFIRRIGVENVKDMMDLRIGDRLGGGTQTAESWRLKLFKKRVEDQLKPSPFSMNDLAIDGIDVMRELNLKPGPKVGEILKKIFEEADEDLSKNKREYLLKRIKQLYETS